MPAARASWASRIALAIGAPLVLLGLLEAGSHLTVGYVDYPLPGVEDAADHIFFATPERISPIFRVDGDAIVTGFETKSHFLVRSQQFPALRTPETVRIAFLGGSSVQGWPFREPGGSFPDIVGELLQARFPDRRIDIINAGVGGYNSFQLVDVAYQLAPLNPDVVVVYAGHNDQGYYGFQQEFLSQVSASGRSLLSIRRIERQANRLNFFRYARRARDRAAKRSVGEDVFNGTADQRSLLGEERFATFAEAHGTLVPAVFGKNLRELVELLADDDTTVLLAPPLSNLRDHAPTEMVHRPVLSEADAEAFASRMEGLRQRFGEAGVGPRVMPVLNETWLRFEDPVQPTGPRVAVGADAARQACDPFLEELKELEKLSPSWAEVSFLRGTCLMHTDPGEALAAFETARDQTYALPPRQRAWGGMQDAVEQTAARTGARFVDLRGPFRAAAEHGVPGGELFVDNLHFSGAGARVVAAAVADAAAELPVFAPGGADGRSPEPELVNLRRTLREAADERHFAGGLDIPGSDPLIITPEDVPPPPPCLAPNLTGELGPGHAQAFRFRSTPGQNLILRLDGAPGLSLWMADIGGEMTAGPLTRPVAEWTSPGDGEAMLIVADHAGVGGAWELCYEGGPTMEDDGAVTVPVAPLQ